MNLAGVTFKQNELRGLMHSQKQTAYFKAQIVAEPTNAFDPQAKKVVCHGLPVGYIPKFLTKNFPEQDCEIEIHWWDEKSIYIVKIL